MESHNEIVEKLLEQFNTDLISKNDIDSHAEVFDKHPITAMSDMDVNNVDRVLILVDSWKPEWCKDGVQVPVNGIEEQKKPILKSYDYQLKVERNFVMPEKRIRSTYKYQFDPDKHIRVQEPRSLLYEVDPLDYSWMKVSNTERQCLGLPLINEHMIEVIFEMLESLCYKRIRTKIREAETEFLEHDENSKCDVCQSPEGEDGNELVFCEDCFICVHQACYGIPELPSGSWICRHCDKCPNSSSRCLLCPNRGGAMKPVENEEGKWAHLSCAVWIPEVGFGNIDLMEPITRFSAIPQARWNLRCHLCKTSGSGAPIQCSERKCKQAFHVTCAIKNNLLMKQEFQTNNDVKLLAFCKVHTKKYVEPDSVVEDVVQGPRDIIELRIEKHKELEQNFHTFANVDDLKNPQIEHSTHLLQSLKTIPSDIKEKVYTYWKLKRTSNHFLSLIKPPAIWSEEHTQQRVNNRSVMGAFCKIRFGLDRARLVVDMMVRREKKKALLFQTMSKISQLQLQQLRTSKQQPLLEEDPSLAANWGMLSTVHLDDNIYVNPGKLIDPNIEFVINRSNINDYDNNNRSSIDFLKQKMKEKVASSPSPAAPPARQVLQSVHNVQLHSATVPPAVSCVYTIPREQLIVPDDIKKDFLDSIQHSSFRNYFMLPLIANLTLSDSSIEKDEEKINICEDVSMADVVNENDHDNVDIVDDDHKYANNQIQRNVFDRFQMAL